MSKLYTLYWACIYYPRFLWRKLKLYIAWMPILAEDEDWDYSYLLRIMKFKISRLRKNIEKENRHFGCEKRIKNMRIVEFLLEREIMGSHPYESKGELCSCQDIDEWLDDTTVLYTNDGEKFEVSNKRWAICDYCAKFRMKKIWSKEKHDWDYLMDLMKKDMPRWWT